MSYYSCVEKIDDHITLVNYPDEEALARAFMRVQEHYESPNDEFRKRPFTIGEYRDWYSREWGGFTYSQDWAGYNVPDYIIRAFLLGLFEPLTAAEEELVELFRCRSDKFYVIGVSSNSPSDTKEHEICHGLYYTNQEYHSEVVSALKNKNLDDLKKFLLENMYCEGTVLDECHAYISASGSYLKQHGISYPKELHKVLRKIRKKHLT